MSTATASAFPTGLFEAGLPFQNPAPAPTGLAAWTAPGRSAEELSSTDLDDLTWLARVQRGDEEAVRRLIHRLYPTVMKSIRCRLPRHVSEEDLAQTVFAKIFSKLHQFSGKVPLEHWVSRIAINTCLNQLQHENVRPELRMSDLTEDEEAVVEQLAHTEGELPEAAARDARSLLDKLLARLKPDERLVITLLHLEEKSSEEISRLTGWSVSLVKVKAFRARNKMRSLWGTLLKRECT